MAKNKRKQKRHLKSALKELNKLVAAKHSKLAERPSKDMTYEEQIELYSQQVATLYNGTVTVKERYINPQATLIHHCSECKRDFYAKPEWLLENSKPHLCYDQTKRVSNKYTSQTKVTEEHVQQMIKLHSKGMSLSAIGRKLNVSRPTVIKYLRKAGAY